MTSSRFVGLVIATVLATRSDGRAQLLCDVEPPGAEPRPIWMELAPPDGSGYPDYQTPTSNLQILNSLTLLASLATRAAESLNTLASEVEDPEAEGNCVCCAIGCSPLFQLNTKRK